MRAGDSRWTIDGHAYCFPPIAAANGFPTAAEHLRYVQREIAEHHQPVWRLRDRAPGSDRTLADPSDRSLDGVTTVNFRSEGYGRFVWTVEGEDYAKQWMPPYLVDNSHGPELLVAQMDYTGIDRAVLHVTPIFGFLNAYLTDCVRRFPDRLLALAHAPEWEIERRPDASVETVATAYAAGLHGLQFHVSARYRYGIHGSWDSLACRPFWDAVTALGRPIFFSLGPWPERTLEAYRGQLDTWRRWLERYPGVAAVLTHGFPWRLFRHGERLRLPEWLFDPFRASSARLEFLLQIALGNIWDYPYAQLRPTVAELVDRLGSERLIWGTDMPNIERFCTYRQSLDTFRVHCAGLMTDQELADLTGGTVARLFELDLRSRENIA